MPGRRQNQPEASTPKRTRPDSHRFLGKCERGSLPVWASRGLTLMYYVLRDGPAQRCCLRAVVILVNNWLLITTIPGRRVVWWAGFASRGPIDKLKEE